MNTDKLIARLAQIADQKYKMGAEAANEKAVRALLDHINDDAVTEAFEEVIES